MSRRTLTPKWGVSKTGQAQATPAIRGDPPLDASFLAAFSAMLTSSAHLAAALPAYGQLPAESFSVSEVRRSILRREATRIFKQARGHSAKYESADVRQISHPAGLNCGHDAGIE